LAAGVENELRGSTVTKGLHDAQSQLKSAAQLYEKSHLKTCSRWMTLKITQSYRKWRCSVHHITIPI